MVDISTLSREEIIRRYYWRCPEHGHNGLAHPKCYERYGKYLPTKVGFWDIESSSLQGNFGYVFSYAILDEEGKMYGRVLKPEEVLNPKIKDKYLMHELCKDLKEFNRVIVWYGGNKRHDAPFSRTRALKHGADFPKFGEGLWITDAYDISKNKLRMHSNRLEAVARFLDVPCKQHPLDEDKWVEAGCGTESALSWIWEHNKEDVYTLKDVWHKIKDFSRLTKTSI